MSQEEEFSKWLRRTEKSFQENFKFAIKSWQSVEFTLPTKYELILQWLIEQKCLKEEEIVEEDFCEFLKLRAQPGLIDKQLKKDFVKWLIKKSKESQSNSRKWPNLLKLLVDFEILQDLYRVDYELQCRVYGQILICYENYVLAFESSGQQFLSTFESEFFANVLKSLKDTIKRCGDISEYEKVYTSRTLQPLVKVLLLLKAFKIDFFDELLEIESTLCGNMKYMDLINRILSLALPVELLCMECAIIKRKSEENFLKCLLNNIFLKFLNESSKEEDTSLYLTLASYFLEMLSRHDVSLKVEMEENLSILQFLGKEVLNAVKNHKDSHLKEVLMLLCASLRLNPLILEDNVFKITVWMILTPKKGDKEEQELFEEYLVLLMDMFRRLSRAEKFVTNLIKNINGIVNLQHFSSSKKRKSKIHLEESPANKKLKLDEVNQLATTPQGNFSKYLNILFEDFFKSTLTKSFKDSRKLSASTSFPKLQYYWPSNPVGLAFSKIITGLVSKPSLTIWKSLLYYLKELLETLKSQEEIDEKDLFQIDFHSALLIQYFAGCKLAEQSDKFLEELKERREFTLEILKLFGQFLLEKEHQARTMTAFLELTYFASNFELLLIYYRPDGCQHESLQPMQGLERLHSFLTPDEWTLIRQRVLNFGKSSCKYLLHRLELQKSQASLLLLTGATEKCPLKLNDSEILASFFKTPQAKWYLQQLQNSEKQILASFFIAKPEFLPLIFDDLELVGFVSLEIYEKLNKSLNSKHSLLQILSTNIEKMRQCVETNAYESLIKELIDTIVNHAQKEYKVKKLSLEGINKGLDLLSQLPLGQLRRQHKTIIFALHLCLYRDLKAAEEETLAIKALDILKDLLHFGQQILIFKYLPAPVLLQLLPPESCWDLYEYLFATIKNEESGTEKFLENLSSILSEAQSSLSINDEQRKLLLASIDTLSSLSGPCAKHMRKHLDAFLNIFSQYLQAHFSSSSDGTSKKDKKFVQKTLAGFAPYALATLSKAAKAKKQVALKQSEQSSEIEDDKELKETKQVEENTQEIDEDFRRISKIYIGNSMDYRNPHAVRLMQIALNHRELLHLDQVEIEFVLSNYWYQIQEDLNDTSQLNQGHIAKVGDKTVETAVKIIIGNKTNEDLLLTLKTIGQNIEKEKFANIIKLLNLIAKCPFSTIKGAIFNEQYKQIALNITLRLEKDNQQNFLDYDLIINLLNSHQTLLDNKMIPISTDTMDSIISFLMDINIKKFNLNDTNLKTFINLHTAMAEVCSSLIKHRHILLMDRVPQYMHIFKDLLQAIIWYKSDRQKDIALSSTEIDDLSESALKLEYIMHLIAQHKPGVKRVAPFVLTFIINLMVANKRPTTLYNKIKTHIENICYELVGICDHRVSRFILRCSNEAGRQLYELLVKDHQKYYKFKGKV